MTPRDLRYEESRVDMVLKAFRLGDHRRSLLQAGRQRYGRPRLTFEVFLERFPTFPIRLSAKYLGRMAERCEPADLLRRADRTPVFDPVRTAFAAAGAADDPRPVGVAVPFAGLKGGAMVHTAILATGGNRLIVVSPDGQPPERAVIEPFRGFLAALARGEWTPDAAPKVVRRIAPPAVPSGELHPWMVRLAGTGPGLVVWAWVVTRLSLPTATGDPFVRRVGEAERAVAATYGEIAAATGLADEQVKRGLRSLRAAGLVATERREGRTFVFLTPEDREPDA